GGPSPSGGFLQARAEPANSPGLAFPGRGSGEIIRTPSRPLLRDPDTLPFPARDLIDHRAYRDAWKSRHGFFSLNIVASRGCPYRCNWCSRTIYGVYINIGVAASVADEMQIRTDS